MRRVASPQWRRGGGGGSTFVQALAAAGGAAAFHAAVAGAVAGHDGSAGAAGGCVAHVVHLLHAVGCVGRVEDAAVFDLGQSISHGGEAGAGGEVRSDSLLWGAAVVQLFGGGAVS